MVNPLRLNLIRCTCNNVSLNYGFTYFSLTKKSPVTAPTDKPANNPAIVPIKITVAKLVSTEGTEAPKKPLNKLSIGFFSKNLGWKTSFWKAMQTFATLTTSF